MSGTPDHSEARGTPETVEIPRRGVKIAVSRTSIGTDVFLGRGVMPHSWVREGIFYVHYVYVEGQYSMLPRFNPVFTVVRNPWEINPEDDRTKQTAIDFVQHADLSVLMRVLREPMEIFRRERAEGVNYAKRSFNIDRARVEAEQVEGLPFPDVKYYILTPQYKPGSHQR